MTANVKYKKRRAVESDKLSDNTQAEFLNFTNYFIFGNLSNLKIWRLSKNAQAIELATTCAIFYIHCVCCTSIC
jgi:hypothetical protein